MDFLNELFFTNLKFPGVDDGCYSDWSLDLLVARKVSELIHGYFSYV